MTEYEVTWKIQLSASSPAEAARLALAIQRDPTSGATFFDVTDGHTEVCDIDAGRETIDIFGHH